MEYYFEGIKRLDWGLGNPNKTAALIATLMVGIWGLAYIRRWMFWVALPVFTWLGVCLVQTFSRGGLLAALVGLGLVLWKAPRPWPRIRSGAVLCSVLCILVAVSTLQAGKRYQKGIVEEDASINNRLIMWSSAPAMMVDAPGGWGLGKAGRAYMEWYQPVERSEGYRTLVNSHLTWLVEFGWLFRILYVFGWSAVLLLCYPQGIRWFAIPFGVWVTFGIAAFFSSVAETVWLWVVPTICLLIVCLNYALSLQWPRRTVWTIPLAITSLAIGAIALCGYATREIPLEFRGDTVHFKGRPPKVSIITTSPVFGSYPGNTMRKFLVSTQPSSRPSFSITDSFSGGLDTDIDVLVLGGEIKDADIPHVRKMIKKAQKVILMNPQFTPSILNLSLGDESKISLVFGEFTQSSTVRSWDNFSTSRKIRVAGVGDFLPHWPHLL